MTTVVTVPPTLDDVSFEQLAQQLAPVPQDERLLVDARHATWASPFGLTALLAVAQSRAVKPSFAPPENENTLSYWARTNFFRHAEEVYELGRSVPRARAAGESSVLLEVTPIAQAGDVHDVVDRIQERSQAIMQGQLHMDPRATIGFTMALSESCQNIIEHAGRGGWVAVQTYNYKRRLGRRVVVIAVCDAGIGFRRSLEQNTTRPRNDRWGDATALEQAVMRSVSRYNDTGRGQGLAGIRRYLGKWEGKLTVRSGTARINFKPDWDDEPPLLEDLAPFPGAQVQITIPEPAARTATAGASGARRATSTQTDAF